MDEVLVSLVKRGMIDQFEIKSGAYNDDGGANRVYMAVNIRLPVDRDPEDEVWTATCRALVRASRETPGVDRMVLEIDRYGAEPIH